MNTMQERLEFDIIKEKLAAYALSDYAKEALLHLTPTRKEKECRQWMERTTAARRVLDALGSPPLSPMQHLEALLESSAKGAMLLPEELEEVAAFAVTCRRLAGYLKRAQAVEERIGAIGASLADVNALQEEIEAAIRAGKVDDAASPALRTIRRKMEQVGAAIQAKLESLLRSHKEWFTDGYVTQRDGHFVLPLRRECRTKLSGRVIATSSTGGTLFLEPSSAAKGLEELAQLHAQEDSEVRTILYTLTSLVDDCRDGIRRNMQAMESLDFLFAKAKLSAALKAVPVKMTAKRRIRLREARHPLLESERCVPLDCVLEEGVRGIVITGPNTGGKTVALKTVGLLSLMGQCGLHIPAAPGCELAMYANYLCALGDGQSITQNLSTFSAHMADVLEILRTTGPNSLVLLDELGSGTDPAEGMGIAVAVLEELRERGCIFLVTTHYPEVKEYAAGAEGLINARMAFDRETLRPLYRMELGEAGESCALYIAKRLGLPAPLLDRASREAYGQPAGELLRGAQTEITRELPPPLQAEEAEKEPQAPGVEYVMGDSVRLTQTGELGIVYRGADDAGMVSVQIKGEKRMVPYKRLRLEVSAKELYPEDYDFSILFDSVEARKARHQMGKRHRPDLAVPCEE